MTSIHQLLSDYYRCPESLLAPDLTSGSPLLPDSPQTVLPPDPAELIEHLRRERYAAGHRIDRQKGRTKLVRKAYYLLRPLLSVPARKHLQRMSLRGWEQKPFPRWPIDRTVDKVFEKLMLLSLTASGTDKIPFIWFWPEGRSSCVTMTHDVETASGLRFCSTLMDLNDSRGIKSSFQIIPEGRYAASDQIRAEIRSRGFEVNVHDWNHDGLLYSDRHTFLARSARINQAAVEYGAKGFRSGALYRNTDWYDAFTFSYDMSVANVGHLDPQPGGCCTLMPYFIGRLLEIPLTTTQDYTLFHIFDDYSIDLWRCETELILEGHGLASFLVHPDYVIEARARYAYIALLEYLSQLRHGRNVWIARPQEINDWWRQRSQMRLAQRNGRWEIEGPGQERACLAYATTTGQSLDYTLEPDAPKQEQPAPTGLVSWLIECVDHKMNRSTAIRNQCPRTPQT